MHPCLSLILLVPTIGLGAIFLTPASNTNLIRQISNTVTFISLCLSVWAFAAYNHTVGGFQFVESLPWVRPLGISYTLGVDGINALLAILVGLGSFTGSLVSNTIKDRIKEYYILLLLMVIGTYGAFLSLDMFFFYFLHEVAAVPTFLLIGIYGSGNKDYAAMKITLYLTAGASLALVGLIALYHYAGIGTFDIVALQQHLTTHPIPVNVQNWIFPLIVVGFGITLTMWPFYTWAPVGYSSAPTAVSMLHAGVLKKLGAYAILRFAIQLMPDAAHIWMPIIAWIAVLNIIYCGLVALTQRDLKYLLSYSSCSHMGYILLGLACLNTIGLNGVVFLMFAHGVMACLAFAVTGYVESQAKTRSLDTLSGITKRLPFIGVCFSMMALASAGVPGFSNFVAEIMVLLGSWDTYRWPTVFAVLGIVITAIYMVKSIRLGFQGPLAPKLPQMTDALTPVSKLPFIILLAAMILVGCWPNLILKHIDSSTKPIVERLYVSRH